MAPSAHVSSYSLHPFKIELQHIVAKGTFAPNPDVLFPQLPMVFLTFLHPWSFPDSGFSFSGNLANFKSNFIWSNDADYRMLETHNQQITVGVESTPHFGSRCKNIWYGSRIFGDWQSSHSFFGWLQLAVEIIAKWSLNDHQPMVDDRQLMSESLSVVRLKYNNTLAHNIPLCRTKKCIPLRSHHRVTTLESIICHQLPSSPCWKTSILQRELIE